MRDLEFNRHQYCIFHFKLSISKLIREHLRDLRIEETQNIKKTFKKPSQKFIDDEIEKIVKEEKRNKVCTRNIISVIQRRNLF